MTPGRRRLAVLGVTAGSVSTPSVELPDRMCEVLARIASETGYAARLASMKTTPARAAHVKALVSAGAIHGQDVAGLLATDKVPDLVWQIVEKLEASRGRDQEIQLPAAERTGSPLAAPATSVRQISSWSIRLMDANSETEFAVDPVRYPQKALPLDLIAHALATLRQEGWELVHTSEDRGVDDAASASFVVRQRFLLARTLRPVRE